MPIQKALRLSASVLLFIIVFGVSAPRAFAAISVTSATGGEAISAETAGGSYTALTGPVLDESAGGQIKSGAITLTAPAGFEFDIGDPAITILLTGSATASKNINNQPTGSSLQTTVATSTITFIQTSQSDVANTLAWQDIRVRPVAGSLLASGDIILSSTGLMTGLTLPLAVGMLTEVDITPPTIASHDPVIAEATSTAGAFVDYTPPATSDTVDGESVASCTPASGSAFALGTTTVTCSAADSHANTSNASFDVIVEMAAPPPVVVAPEDPPPATVVNDPEAPAPAPPPVRRSGGGRRAAPLAAPAPAGKVLGVSVSPLSLDAEPGTATLTRMQAGSLIAVLESFAVDPAAITRLRAVFEKI